MTGRRRTLIWIGAALAGLVIAAALTTAAAQLSNQTVGISSEPVTAGDELAPAATPAPAETPTRTATPRPTRTATPRPTRTPTPPPAQTAAPTAHDHGGGDDSSGRGRGRGGGDD